MRLLVFFVSLSVACTPTHAQTREDPTGPLSVAEIPTEAVEGPARPLQFENLTVNDGLSDGSVQAILQDRFGYLWFGTFGGLDRYDGSAFVNYKPIPFDSTSLSDGSINGIYEDDEGTLWITTQNGGLNLFDSRRQRFTHYYYHDKNAPSSLGHDVLCKVHPSQSDALWICTLGGGLDRFDPGTETFEHYRHVPGDSASLSNNYVYDAYEDPSGFTWVATGNGLNRLTPERDAFRRYFYTRGDPRANSSIPHQWFRYIHPDPSDPYLLWLGTGSGIVRFDARTERFRRYLSASVFSMVDDPNAPGVLWLVAVGAEGGLYRFDTRTGQYNHYRHVPGAPQSLISNALWSIAADRSGMIWVGAANGRGVSRFDPRGAAFQHYRAASGGTGILSLSEVWDIQEDSEGHLWVAVRDATGRGALNRIDRRTGEVKHYAHDPTTPEGLGTGIPSPLHVDQTGRVWTVTADGLEKLDPATGRVTRFDKTLPNPQRISWQNTSWNDVTAIYEARFGDLWIGTRRGLYKMDLTTGTVSRYLHEANDSHYTQKQDVTAILEDHAGTLWVGTAEGLGWICPPGRAAGLYTRLRTAPR